MAAAAMAAASASALSVTASTATVAGVLLGGAEDGCKYAVHVAAGWDGESAEPAGAAATATAAEIVAVLVWNTARGTCGNDATTNGTCAGAWVRDRLGLLMGD